MSEPLKSVILLVYYPCSTFYRPSKLNEIWSLRMCRPITFFFKAKNIYYFAFHRWVKWSFKLSLFMQFWTVTIRTKKCNSANFQQNSCENFQLISNAYPDHLSDLAQLSAFHWCLVFVKASQSQNLFLEMFHVFLTATLDVYIKWKWKNE